MVILRARKGREQTYAQRSAPPRSSRTRASGRWREDGGDRAILRRKPTHGVRALALSPFKLFKPPSFRESSFSALGGIGAERRAEVLRLAPSQAVTQTFSAALEDTSPHERLRSAQLRHCCRHGDSAMLPDVNESERLWHSALKSNELPGSLLPVHWQRGAQPYLRRDDRPRDLVFRPRTLDLPEVRTHWLCGRWTASALLPPPLASL